MQGGMREGRGNCRKYVKRGWNGKKGSGKAVTLKSGKAVSWAECLKRGGGGLEPRYELWPQINAAL